ncbi:substrate-binding domain-containing protein [Metallumcola ferriviriculae]|uniref:Substrate-binding domain-containing protein n=1 Tax=Metallumcola ferriviriculae TaxID=3039180 RepID=A0AAU0UL75_9FIRM|nr:substrate-binding domain-containing protein [Desulfitibacteraceae bacterium MK1]
MSNGIFEISVNLPGGIPGEIFFGLLKATKRYGSLSRAAEEVGVSYRYAWGLIKKAEKQLSLQLLITKSGGSSGGGAELTADAEEMMADFLNLTGEIANHQQMVKDSNHKVSGYLLLATTLEPVETGLLAVLADAFLKETGINLRHIPAGSGQAMEMASQGRVDLLLTHAPVLELEFIQAGLGAKRQEIMSNPFILIGPNNDPAGIRNKDIMSAMSQVAAFGAAFISRNDNSGTHLKEKQCWEKLGINPVKPWYRASSHALMGNLGVLKQAAMCRAYALVDRATFLMFQKSDNSLKIAAWGNEDFQNPFSLVTLSKQHFPYLNHNETEAFFQWITNRNVLKLIAEFGKQTFGQTLFYPKK